MDKIDKEFLNWVHVTSVFLSRFEEEHEKNNPIYNQVYQDFLVNFGFEPNDHTFHTWNQASILMTLYGIFIIPKEFWRNALGENQNEKIEADNFIFENLDFDPRDFFENCNEMDSFHMSNDTFLRRFRNSLAHCNFKIDTLEGKFEFWNINKNGVKNFSVKSDKKRLSNLINKMSSHFVYGQRNN